MYAEAAVDGSEATTWSPTASPATLTVDLGTVQTVSSVVTKWGATAPASSRILTSTDGTTFTQFGNPTGARYVRVEVTSSGTTHAELAELEVR